MVSRKDIEFGYLNEAKGKQIASAETLEELKTALVSMLEDIDRCIADIINKIESVDYRITRIVEAHNLWFAQSLEKIAHEK